MGGLWGKTGGGSGRRDEGESVVGKWNELENFLIKKRIEEHNS